MPPKEPCMDNESWCRVIVAYDLEQCNRYPSIKEKACRKTCGECTVPKCSNPIDLEMCAYLGCSQKCLNGWNVCGSQFYPGGPFVFC